ncbi:MAG: HAD family hydrolase [Alphaproteobacteria bacterium]|nr:HAD family hydrolase [Alphaproteobacteria bacterium]
MTHKKDLSKNINWIFFDLGSTIIDETKADLHRIQEMTAGTNVTVERYYEKRLEFFRQGLSGDKEATAFFGLIKTPWHNEDETLFPDAVATLTELKHRGLKLGVIANQNTGMRERLKNWNLLKYFDVMAISSELGMEKPDPEMFKWALKQANCPAQNAAIVGDRLDNDIVPANQIGMYTIRVLRGPRACQEPRNINEQPDQTIGTLADILTNPYLRGGTERNFYERSDRNY